MVQKSYLDLRLRPGPQPQSDNRGESFDKTKRFLLAVGACGSPQACCSGQLFWTAIRNKSKNDDFQGENGVFFQRFFTFSRRVLTTCSPHVQSDIWEAKEFIWTLVISNGLIILPVLASWGRKIFFVCVC